MNIQELIDYYTVQVEKWQGEDAAKVLAFQETIQKLREYKEVKDQLLSICKVMQSLYEAYR